MIADEHLIFSHALEGLPIHVAEKRDGILLNMSRHQHLEKSGVEVVHVRNQRLPLIEGAPTVNDFPGALWAKSHYVHRRMDPVSPRIPLVEILMITNQGY